MKREKREENQNVVPPFIVAIIIIGVILGIIAGCLIGQYTTSIGFRIAFCIVGAGLGPVITILFAYVVFDAIDDVLNIVKTIRNKN